MVGGTIPYEELDDLPATWRRLDFSDALSCESFRVGKVQRADYQEKGTFPIVDQGQELIAGYWNEPRDVYGGPLPVIVFGDHTRIFKFVDFPFICGADGTKVLVPDRDRFDPQFLYFALLTVKLPSRGYNRHFRVLREKVLPEPPLPEQRRIARVLRTVQQAREQTDQVIAAARQFRRSLMQHFFTEGPGGLGKDSELPVDTEIGSMPSNWELVRLDDVMDAQLGKMLSPKARGGLSPRPYLRNVNVQWGRVDISDLLEMDFSAPERDKFSLRPGDILVCEGGEPGRTAMWDGQLEECYFQKALHRLRPKDGRLLPRFFLYHMENAIRLRGAYGVQGTKTTIAHLPGVKLKALPIPLPPLKEQEEITAALGAADGKIEVERQRRDAIDALFGSLLHDLMTARLRVEELAAESDL